MRPIGVLIFFYLISEFELSKSPRRQRTQPTDLVRYPEFPHSSSSSSDDGSRGEDSETKDYSTSGASEAESSSEQSEGRSERTTDGFEEESHATDSEAEREKDIGDVIGRFDRHDVGADDSVGIEVDEDVEIDISMNLDILEKFFKGSTAEQIAYHPGAFNRERVQLINTTLNQFTLPINPTIRKWISVGQQAVGIGSQVMAFLKLANESYTLSYKDIPADDADIFEWWDNEEMTLQTYLIVAQDARIDWYQIVDENEMVQIWSWSLINPINLVKIFWIENDWKLLVLSETSHNYNAGSRKITIYGMNFLQDWWLEQNIAGQSAAVVTRDGKYIITVSNSLGAMFVYQYSDKRQRYIQHQNISVSAPIKDISTFDIGYTCFVAVACENSVIYRLRDGNLTPCTVENFSLGEVETWLPVLVDYLRDETILMFQKQLHHFTHTNTIIEALTWNGNSFKLLEHAPCHSNDDTSLGLSCIASESTELGLIGAAAVSWEDGIVNIVTNKIFEIHTEIVGVPDPADEEAEYILKTMKMLQEKYTKQEDEKKQLELILTREPSFIAKHWYVRELEVPILELDGALGDYLMDDSSFQINGVPWSFEKQEKLIQSYKNKLQEHKIRIDNAISHIKDIVKKDDPDLNSMDISIHGNLEIKGELHARNADINKIDGGNINDKYENAYIEGDTLYLESSAEELDFLKIDDVVVDGYFNNFKLSKENSIDPVHYNGNLVLNKPLKIHGDIHIRPGGLLNNLNLSRDIIASNTVPANDENILSKLVFEDVQVLNVLNVSGKINDVYVSNDELGRMLNIDSINSTKSLSEDSTFSTLSADSVKVNVVNGVVWEDFIKRCIFLNEDTSLDRIETEGNVTFMKSPNIAHLNGLEFPNDYVSQNENSAIQITGKKRFDWIKADAIDCAGKINDIKLENLVTLSTQQNLQNMTFAHLTVTESLDIQDNINGKKADSFFTSTLSNDTKTISSDVLFQYLNVHGNVFIKNSNETLREGILTNPTPRIYIHAQSDPQAAKKYNIVDKEEGNNSSTNKSNSSNTAYSQDNRLAKGVNKN